MIHSAFEIIGTSKPTPFLFSCEHASNSLPKSLSPSKKDQRFLQTHWAWDIGVPQLLRTLVQMTPSQAIFARFSRLLIDPNRSLNRSDLIVPSIEGHSLSFNQNLSVQERNSRLEKYYHPYHQAFDEMVETRCQSPEPFVLISFHSFTPVWNGDLRSMDIGLLYDDHNGNDPHLDLVSALESNFQEQGFFTARNKPYTGQSGLMFSVQQQGRKHKVPHIELEFNQATLSSPERIQSVAQRVFSALEQLNL